VVPDGSAYSTVKSLIQSPNALWSVIGIVTAKPDEISRTVMGLPVVGETSALEHWITVTHADGVAFIPGDLPQPEFRSLISTCLSLEKPVFIIPPADEWLRSPGTSRLRQLTADDLLSHSIPDLDLDGVADKIADRTVLVTGAAGSVGSELCKILISLDPRRLVLVDNNESGLFDLAEELRLLSTVDVREVLVSVTDREQLLTVFTDERPDLVFHAAAYKHVPMLELHPEQAIMVNVIGTRNTIWCAEAVGTRQFILISTDKAASSHSVMGSSKRICELLVMSHSGSMQCCAVRFGNVVGSRGSVVPIFERQIHRGGPVTITHPEMTRYMMTSRQAASLVVSTVVLPAGHLYMLDMGEPVRILDLANALIRSRGLRPEIDIQVVFTGQRPGERMSETLLGSGESWRPTQLSSVYEIVTSTRGTGEDLNWTIERLYELARDQKTTELTRVLKQAVWSPTAEVDEPVISPAEDASGKKHLLS
jgi:FlaA1/EpsC-like NDP-sugar epimerase